MGNTIYLWVGLVEAFVDLEYENFYCGLQCSCCIFTWERTQQQCQSLNPNNIEFVIL